MGNLIKVNPSEYGLQPENADLLTKGLEVILIERDALVKLYEQATKMEINLTNCKYFKDLRLKIRNNRTKGIEPWHKKTKEYHFAACKFIDATKNKECEINEQMEGKLEENEKYLENQEKERLLKLKTERFALCLNYTQEMFIADKLELMSSEAFESYLSGLKMQFEAQKEAERKAEQERIEKERKFVLHNTRLRVLMPYSNYIEDFTEKNFGEMSEEIFAEIFEAAKKVDLQEKQKQAEIKAENERLIKEAEEQEREREKQAKIQRELQAKADQERKENERLQKELADKKAAEEKAEKERKEAEKKAANAPEKEKIKTYLLALYNLQRPEMVTPEAIALMAEISNDLKIMCSKFKNRYENL